MLSREKTVVLARKPDGSELSLDVKFEADSSGVREELACVPALRYLGLRFEAESDPLCNFVAEATPRCGCAPCARLCRIGMCRVEIGEGERGAYRGIVVSSPCNVD